MRAEESLQTYAKEASDSFEGIFDREQAGFQALGMPDIVRESVSSLRDFASGGKRMRGALVLLGFNIAGGAPAFKEELVKASNAYEIIHSCLLIHDDIMDRDKTRRGGDALHVAFAKQVPKRKLSGSPGHYGLSMAINTGDLGAFLALENMASLRLPVDRVLEATRKTLEIFKVTAGGQAIDLELQRRSHVTEDEVLAIYEFKTAWYSVAGPLEVGATLGGADQGLTRSLHQFGIWLGKAFQLEDDLLGLFGDSRILGKPTGSDLVEGKKTLILLKLLEMSPPDDQKFVLEVLGHGRISHKSLQKVRDIAESSGALKYCRELGEAMVGKGKDLIPDITADQEMQHTLRSLADFMIGRSS